LKNRAENRVLSSPGKRSAPGTPFVFHWLSLAWVHDNPGIHIFKSFLIIQYFFTQINPLKRLAFCASSFPGANALRFGPLGLFPLAIRQSILLRYGRPKIHYFFFKNTGFTSYRFS
jgi:hypothetical protein